MVFFFNNPATTATYTFPYTTLFRSLDKNDRDALDLWSRDRGKELAKLNETLARRQVTDRKSTRLNSSHANISYAVFCLKKKKRDSRADQPSHQQTFE